MRVMVWALRTLLFLLLFGFALKNTEAVVLRFYFGTTWEIPLVVLIFIFLTGGMLLGIVSVSGILLRQRREIARLKASPTAPAAVPVPAPPLDAPVAD